MSIYEGFDPSQVPEPFGNRHDPKHTSSDLVERMKAQIELWRSEEQETDWWKYQYEYAAAADRIKQLETALRIIVRETTAVSPDVLNQQMCIDAVNRHAIAALGDGL